jgi:hypothetical protein
VGEPRHEERVVNDNHASSSILPILKDPGFKARAGGPEVPTNPKQANAKALFDHLTEKLWLADA